MCLGSQAIFGRTEVYVDYVDPKTKHLFHNVEVRQGPESVVLSNRSDLPFWYGGPQYEIVEAGFGPFALSRLASATGGIYFITRFDTRRMGFDPARMREYKPDWVRRDEYEKQVNHSSLRQAVLTAAQITQQKLPGMPTLYFPAADGPEFKERWRSIRPSPSGRPTPSTRLWARSTRWPSFATARNLGAGRHTTT